MRLRRLFGTAFTAMALAASLAGCSLFEKKVRYPCPRVFIVGDAGNLVRFKPGPGRDITDILFEARIADFTGSCEYEDDGVDIELNVSIAVERGAANRSRDVGFSYFVAIPAWQPRPEGKRIFPVTGKFEETGSRLVYQDQVKMFIPLDNLTKGPALEVVMGFQLSPRELEYNRSVRGR